MWRADEELPVAHPVAEARVVERKKEKRKKKPRRTRTYSQMTRMMRRLGMRSFPPPQSSHKGQEPA